MGASQKNTPLQLEQDQNETDTDQGETDTEPRVENPQAQPDEENTESRATPETTPETANEIIISSIEIALNQIENDARAIVESTERRSESDHTDGEESEVERSEEALTFDDNHFSTPVGGASPARTPRSRRRRTTASSLENSEVRTRWEVRRRRGTQIKTNSTIFDENYQKLLKIVRITIFPVFCFIYLILIHLTALISGLSWSTVL